MRLVQRRIEFGAHGIRIVFNLRRWHIERYEGLPHQFEPRFEFRLHHFSDPQVMELVHLGHAFGAGDDRHAGRALAHLRDDRAGSRNKGNRQNHQACLAHCSRVPTPPPGWHRRRSRASRRPGLLDPALIQLNDHKR